MIGEPEMTYKLNQRSVTWLLEQLREARKDAGYTLEDAAVKAGTSQSRASRIETGADNPTVDALMAYAASLGQVVLFKLVPDERGEKALEEAIRDARWEKLRAQFE